jgi:hypothetical protein
MIAARAARTAAAVLVPLAAITCIMHAPACKDEGTHVYLGRLFVEARDCLGTSSTVDVVSGGEPGECAPVCLLQLRAEGGRATYVATMCAPYPAAVEFDLSGTDPTCAPALAALARGDTCLSDGGDTHPAPDAAADASDASTDASTDAVSE